MTTMQASVVTKYGGPEVLKIQQVAIPTPKQNEILIRVHASCASTAGAMMRSGTPKYARLFLGLNKPKKDISGTGFSGEVVQLGQGVANFKLGDMVFGSTGVNFAANADYVCIAADGLVLHKPDTVSHEIAASCCDGLITSMNFLYNLADLKPKQHILIIGASGSLGTAAVQLAKNMGAQVTAVCSAANAELVKSLGADIALDYNKTDYTKCNTKYDVIYDTIGTSTYSKCKRILKEKGQYLSPVLSLGLLLQMMLTSVGGGKKAKFSATGMLSVNEQLPLLKEAANSLASGQIKMVMDKVFSLQDIAKAHAYVDTGHKKGNIAISHMKATA